MKLIGTLFLSLFFITACSTSSYSIQSAEISGNPVSLPMKITDNTSDKTTSVQFKISHNLNKKFSFDSGSHTLVNNKNVFEVKRVKDEQYYEEVKNANLYKYKGENFSWSKPEFQGNVQIEHHISESMALKGGLSFSKINRTELFGANFGLGYLVKNKELGLRFDFDCVINTYSNKFDYVLIKDIYKLFSDNHQEITFHSVSEKETSLDLNFSTTLNTSSPDWFFNYLFSISFGKLCLINHDFRIPPKTNSIFNDPDDIEYSEAYLNFTFGVYKSFSNKRLLFGYKINSFKYHNRSFLDNSRWNGELVFQVDLLF